MLLQKRIVTWMKVKFLENVKNVKNVVEKDIHLTHHQILVQDQVDQFHVLVLVHHIPVLVLVLVLVLDFS